MDASTDPLIFNHDITCKLVIKTTQSSQLKTSPDPLYRNPCRPWSRSEGFREI